MSGVAKPYRLDRNSGFNAKNYPWMIKDQEREVRPIQDRFFGKEEVARLNATCTEAHAAGLAKGRAESAVRIAEEAVDFYEREFYPLSNFSAFKLRWQGRWFDTSEHAYHWEKFAAREATAIRTLRARTEIRKEIRLCLSAHEAFKLAEKYKAERRPDWDEVKVEIMRRILRAKADQHEYVHRKLLETGDRELIECSWRDDFWGWGPNRDGHNMLGKLWMEIRSERRAAQALKGKT